GIENLIDFPVVFAGLDDSISCESPILNIEETLVDGNYLLEWETIDGAFFDTSNPTSILVSAPGTYTLTATNESNGCSSSDEVVVLLDGNLSIDPELITLPNVLTTNRDLLNQEFRPFLKNNPGLYINSLMSNVHLVVVNRWGNEVYSTDDSEIWNGESDGETLADGVYFYIYEFDLTCGSKQRIEKKGMIQITSGK
ncbi:MAG: gliding motility-associated C-terminal domain-containing protein, partial [Flavobacteriales bacterium]